MIYDNRSHCLLDGKDVVKLGKMEQKLLIMLANNQLITYEEISERIYNDKFENTKVALRSLIRRFRKKTKCKIIPMYYRGYVLKTDIYFK